MSLFLKPLSLLRLQPNRQTIPLQILSDLHLEVGQQYSSFDFPCAAPYLILAGDIGRLSSDYDAYLGFLRDRCCNRFMRVFLVLGNHEFYGGSHAGVLNAALALEREPVLEGRLIVLHRRRFDVPESDVTILGCTLHSFIPPGSATEAVRAKIQDFRRIEGWMVENHNAEHDADVRWLMGEVEQIRRQETQATGNQSIRTRRRRIVVVTHHAPCVQGASDPRHVNNPWNSAFATDLLPHAAALPKSEGRSSPLLDVQWWIFGHTHFTTEFALGGVRLVSNQRGYILPGNVSDSGKTRTRTLGGLRADRGIQYRPDRVIRI